MNTFVKHLNYLIIICAICLALFLSSGEMIYAQSFFVDINVINGEIDAAWNQVSPIVENDLENGVEQDIVNAYFAADQTNPSILFFRIDGYNLLENLEIQLDCDANGQYTDEADRAFSYLDDDLYGDGLGDVQYGVDNPDIFSTMEILGEYTVAEDGFEQIEVELNLRVWNDYVLEDEDEEEAELMGPCLQAALGSDGKPTFKEIGVVYSTADDATPSASIPVLTAVSLRSIEADVPMAGQTFFVLGGILAMLTVCLFAWRKWILVD